MPVSDLTFQSRVFKVRSSTSGRVAPPPPKIQTQTHAVDLAAHSLFSRRLTSMTSFMLFESDPTSHKPTSVLKHLLPASALLLWSTRWRQVTTFVVLCRTSPVATASPAGTASFVSDSVGCSRPVVTELWQLRAYRSACLSERGTPTAVGNECICADGLSATSLRPHCRPTCHQSN